MKSLVAILEAHVAFCARTTEGTEGDEKLAATLSTGVLLGLRLAFDHPEYARALLMILDVPPTSKTPATSKIAQYHVDAVPIALGALSPSPSREKAT